MVFGYALVSPSGEYVSIDNKHGQYNKLTSSNMEILRFTQDRAYQLKADIPSLSDYSVVSV